MNNQVNVYRNTKQGSLEAVKNLGFYPKVVIDVGAQVGTAELYGTFPDSFHLLIEPVKENERQLNNVCKKLKNAEYIIAGAAKESGQSILRITKNFQYSKIIDQKDTDKEIFKTCFHRTVPVIRLDELCEQKKINGPYLIKVDVDGSEVDVLAGAVKILKNTEFVIVESTLFGQIYDVLEFMGKQDFVIYDIVDPVYRPLDMALWQVDISFVKKEGLFRNIKSFAIGEQSKAMATSPVKNSLE